MNMTKKQRDRLFKAHQDLRVIHGHVAAVTGEIHKSGQMGDKVLDAQLAISEAMTAVSNALDISPEPD